jgi:hypothetical protein
MIEIKFYWAQFDLHDASLLNKNNWSLLLLIIYKTLPSCIHQLGSVYLPYLGEIEIVTTPSDKNLLAHFVCRFFFLLFELEIRNA